MIRTRESKRVSKEQWLTVALEELERGGVNAVRVERLAKILNISKSGFYWHFQNRDDLLRQLLEYWFHETTEVVTSNPLLLLGDPINRLKNAAKAIQDHELGKYELALRGWAKQDETARQIVQQATKTRLNFVRGIFSDMGFEGDELEMRTTLFVSYQAWESATFGDMSPRKLTRLRNRRLALLTKP